MPGRFLSVAERDRLRNFPDTITPDDLITYFMLSEEDLAEVNKRRRVGVQLNIGEALHALRRYLFFANHGRIRRGQLDEQMNQASCLNLVTNAVVAWNTIYIAEIIQQLESEGHHIHDEDLLHLSPARYKHINPYGRYHFDIEQSPDPKSLRSLRHPSGP